MVEDRFHIEMEDISQFEIERSADYSFWEDLSQEELQKKTLCGLSEDKLKRFLEVVRTGGVFKLNDYYYRIKTS